VQGINIKLYMAHPIPPKDLFPGIRTDTKSLIEMLKPLSLTDTVFACAKLSWSVSDPMAGYPEVRQAALAERFLPDDVVRRARAHAREQGGFEHSWVFSRPPLLELARLAIIHCDDKSNDGYSFDDIGLRRVFFQALSIMNDRWVREAARPNILGTQFSLYKTIDSLASSRRSIEGGLQAPDLRYALGRARLIFGGLYSQDLVRKFEERNKISVADFLQILTVSTATYLRPNSDARHFQFGTQGVRSRKQEAIKLFLESQSQTLAGAREWELECGSRKDRGFKVPDPFKQTGYMDKPIIRSVDDRGIIVDPVYYCDKLATGPVFLLKKPPDGMREFGNAFEKYGIGVLERMLGRDNVVPGFVIPGTDLEIDALASIGDAVFLFEIKTGWIKESTVSGDRPSDYIAELRKKFSSIGEGGKHKGTAQIARFVDALTSDVSGSGLEVDPGRLIVYPVMVFYDDRMVAPGHPLFFDDEFQRFLKPDGAGTFGLLKKNGIAVQKLIVLTKRDIEVLECADVGLEEVLNGYCRMYHQRGRSFHDYVSISRFSSNLRENEYLFEQSRALLEETSEEVFGVRIQEDKAEAGVVLDDVLSAIKRAYGSFESPRYDFVHAAEGSQIYKATRARLESLADEFEETTDTNYDVAFFYVLKRGDDRVSVVLSMVGQFAIVQRIEEDGNLRLIDLDSPKKSKLEQEVIRLLLEDEFTILDRATLVAPTKLPPEPGNEGPVTVYQALFHTLMVPDFRVSDIVPAADIIRQRPRKQPVHKPQIWVERSWGKRKQTEPPWSLEMDNEELMARVRELGYEIKSQMSTLDELDAQIVVEKLSRDEQPSAAEPGQGKRKVIRRRKRDAEEDQG